METVAQRHSRWQEPAATRFAAVTPRTDVRLSGHDLEGGMGTPVRHENLLFRQVFSAMGARVADREQAVALVTRSQGEMSLVVMFFSACDPGLQKRFPELVRFVLNRDDEHLPCDLVLPRVVLCRQVTDGVICTSASEAFP